MAVKSPVSYTRRTPASQQEGKKVGLRGDSRISLNRLLGKNANPSEHTFDFAYSRIISSRYYRRLGGIYQFHDKITPESVNRLDHTLQVAEVGNRLADGLKFDKQSREFVKCICAVHDIGHPPFGHSGERAIQKFLSLYDLEWNHDASGLRVITEWAGHDPAGNGLNLPKDVIEGLAKRYWRYDNKKFEELARNNKKDHYLHHTSELPESVLEIDRKHNLHLDKWNHIEGQIAAISDWIAFTATDIAEGLRNRSMRADEILEHLPMAGEFLEQLNKIVLAHYEENPDTTLAFGQDEMETNLSFKLTEFIREKLIADVIETTNKNIEDNVKAGKLTCAEDVRNLDSPIVSFSPKLFNELVHFDAYCHKTVFPRLEQAIGPMEEWVGDVARLYQSGVATYPENSWWHECYNRIQQSDKEDYAKARAAAELACIYMTSVLTDADIIEHIKLYLPEKYIKDKAEADKIDYVLRVPGLAYSSKDFTDFLLGGSPTPRQR